MFINCPFDRDYAPLLQAMMFCVIYLGFTPQIASEDADAGALRLEKITGLIRRSKYSIHDLSRSRSAASGEYYRLNMPFELGIDYGCRRYSSGAKRAKKILILETERFSYHASISDLAGCDLQTHGGDFQVVIRKVRNWLVSEAGAVQIGATRILNAYDDFQEWHYEAQLAAGFSEADIQDYPTAELLGAMNRWVAKGKPI